VFLQVFDEAGAPLTEPCLTTADGLAAAIPAGITRFAGDAAHLLAGAPALLPHGLPDPGIVARLARSRPADNLPAPLYLRGADAELPRDGPPPLLD
jgi:hypothetical protein